MCQPPSGGCVLKLLLLKPLLNALAPAAFGRLCVETAVVSFYYLSVYPAAFGRLCVETIQPSAGDYPLPPAAFGRLCVETRPV